MLGLEVRKTFLRLRAVTFVVVALLPVAILTFRALAHVMSSDRSPDPIGEVVQTYGVVFQLFFLRFVVYFGCFGIFTYLVRGELLERSLHFYFLAPMRREVFVIGKYVAGLIAGTVLFGASVIAQLFVLFLPQATQGGWSYLLSKPGLAAAAAYLGVTVLGVAGYGALFLALGLLVRNPMIPAAILYGWEWANFLLPSFLKKLSVIHHLQSLCPVPVPSGPFALPAEPTPPWLAVLGLVLVIAALLIFGARRARRLEVTYASE